MSKDVIGGMNRGFKRKLYHALGAMDDAGLSPGITSGSAMITGKRSPATRLRRTAHTMVGAAAVAMGMGLRPIS